MEYFRPIAMTDPARPKSALALAGGWCWFDRVEVLSRAAAGRIIPASSDHVVKMLGMETEQQLKDAIKARLGQRVATQQQVAMRQQIAKFLTDNTKMDLPVKMASYQAARILENRRMELMYRGVDAQKIEEHMAELRTASGSLAQRDLKLFFILQKAAETLGVSVDENEINQRIAQMAWERNVRPDRLRAEIIQTNRVGAVYNQIREHKTMDAIIAKARSRSSPSRSTTRS